MVRVVVGGVDLVVLVLVLVLLLVLVAAHRQTQVVLYFSNNAHTQYTTVLLRSTDF